MMIIAVISSFLLLSQLISARKIVGSKNNFDLQSPSQKKKLSNLRTASTVVSKDVEPSFYIALKYPSSYKCEKDWTYANAYPLNVCKIGYERGQAVGSGMEKINTNEDNSQYVHTTFYQYSSLNCTGDFTVVYEIAYPEFCIPNTSPFPENFHFYSVGFEMQPVSDISAHYKNGVIVS